MSSLASNDVELAVASRRRRPLRRLIGWGTVLVVLAIWQLIGSSGDLYYLPSVTAIISSSWSLVTGPSLGQDVLPSLERAAVGYAIGSAVGIVGGILLGSFRTLDPWTRPVLEFVRALPPPMFIPLALILFGLNDTTRVASIAFGCLWPVQLNAMDGARAVDPLLLDSARMARAGKLRQLVCIILPASLTQIFAGLRFSLAVALVMMVVSELVGSASGLGYLLLQNEGSFAFTAMWADVLALSIVGWLATNLIGLIERRVLSWHIQRWEQTDA